MCDLLFVHFCLYFVSKFYFFHLFNSSISTSKIVNDISFFFFTLLCFRVAIQSYVSLVYDIAGRAACGPWHLHIPGSRLEEQNRGANLLHPFSFRISWQKSMKGTITHTQSLKCHKAAKTNDVSLPAWSAKDHDLFHHVNLQRTLLSTCSKVKE